MKQKSITLKKFHKEQMKDPEYRKAYNSLELEYQLIELMIDARIKRRLTQRKLAQMTGITQSVIARFESGNANPTLSFLQKLTFALGTKLKLTKI